MRVTINNDEEVEVGDDTDENFFVDDPDAINDSVFRCPDCKTGTIHQGYEFTAYANHDEVELDEPIKRRIYLCTNCGKFSTK